VNQLNSEIHRRISGLAQQRGELEDNSTSLLTFVSFVTFVFNLAFARGHGQQLPCRKWESGCSSWRSKELRSGRLLAAAYLFSFIYIQVLGCIVGSKTAAATLEVGVCSRTPSPHRTRPREI